MLGLFLTPDAPSAIGAMPIDPTVKKHALEVVEKGYTVIRNALPESTCRESIAAFRRFEHANEAVFAENRDAGGHYPRIVNLHCALKSLIPLFTKNTVWLQVQDVL